MKNYLLILVIMFFYSCGETEYQKRLKAEIFGVNTGISMDSTKIALIEKDFSKELLKKESDPIVLKYLSNEKEKLQNEMKNLELRKTDLELELAKTK